MGYVNPNHLRHDGTWFSDGMTLPRALDLEDTTGAADHPIHSGWMQHQVLQRIGPARSGFVELELLCRRQSARRVDGTRPRREPHRAVLELADAVDVPEPDPVVNGQVVVPAGGQLKVPTPWGLFRSFWGVHLLGFVLGACGTTRPR